MRRHGLVAAQGNHRRHVDPVDALGGQFGQLAFQHRQGAGVRMADHHHRTLTAGDLQAALEGGGHRFRAGVVIEKQVAGQAGQCDALGAGGGHRLRRGAAVDEEQMASLQLRHQRGHRRFIGCHQTAHVVVQAAGLGDRPQRRLQTFQPDKGRLLGLPGEVAVGRGHRHVHQHGTAGAVGIGGQNGRMRRVRQDGQGHRARQGQHAAIALRVMTQVVDDQAQVNGLGRKSGARKQQAERDTQRAPRHRETSLVTGQNLYRPQRDPLQPVHH